jgi:steroid 5-alpha reductase family enzyme
MVEIADLFVNFWPLIWGIVAVLSFFIIAWMISVKIKNVGIVDWIWGIGFVIQASVYVSKDSELGVNYPRIIYSALVMLHGIRLSIHITIRSWGKGEDKRYTKYFREESGEKFWWVSLFNVFLIQAITNLIVGLCIYTFNSVHNLSDINLAVFFVGAAVMFIGTIYEGIADYQLYSFKNNSENAGKVINSGLWYFCRHPNYFGESLFWIGNYIVNLSAVIWFVFFSPLIMMYTIISITGIAIMKKSKENDEKYGSYIRTTSAFIPWCKLKDNGFPVKEHDGNI